MSNIKIISLNVKGINHVIKRQKILSFLKKEKCQVAFLQETHLSDLEHVKLRRSWVGQVFYSSYNSRSRGAAILLHRSLPFTLEKTVHDKEGRYVLLSGYLFGEHVSFGCVYAPTAYEASFFSQLFSDLASLSSSYLVVGGDFNCVLNPSIDASPPRPALSKKSTDLLDLMKDADLYDVWRTLHPLDKDYTFFSIPHQAFSRIDYFLSSRSVLSRIVNCSIGIQSISDHSPVAITISPPYRDPSFRHWRLNPVLLQKQCFIDHITAEIGRFFAENNTPGISPTILWESAKAYLRGSIISYSSAQKKDAIKKQLELEETVCDLQAQLKRSYSTSLAKRLEAAQSALNQLLTQKAEAQIFFAKHRLFEAGNKPGRLLARLARGINEPNLIPSLIDKHGCRHFKSADLNKVMRSFYEELYSSDYISSAEARSKFLDRLDLPYLSDDQKEALNRPISKEEVLDVIKNLKGGKAPGPDGFGADFYKAFGGLLVDHLTNMYLDSFDKGCLPPTLNLAHISVILKKGKPPEQCGSYRPISLISVDNKILSKLLAKRLENLLPVLINSDQTGFIRGRHSLSNVRRLLNIVQYTTHRKKKALSISLDAEKAFDRVEMCYLFDIMQKFGLDGDFLKWTRTIYHSPTAAVITNGLRSAPFSVARGVRQGCPLSPLLFALALEPLAERIRCDADVKGIELGAREHKIALYADDILLFVTSPESSIPAIMNILNEFSTISGYKINYDKSEAMPLGPLTNADVLDVFPFRWSASGFKYLGVKICPDLRELRKLNFVPVYTVVKRDLERWHNLPLSLFGRVSLVKMNVLPRLLYPLQMLPIYLTKKVNRDLERVVSKFIWQGKKPRQRLKLLQLPTNMGGLSVPNLIFYNWACHAQHLWVWLHTYIKNGACVDSWACSPHSPWSLTTCDVSNVKPELKHNPIIYNSVRVWRDITKFLGRKHLKSSLSPITQNPDFPAGVGSSVFCAWRDKGIHVLADLFRDNTLMSFQQLQELYNIPKTHFFGYLQIRHFASSLSNAPLTSLPLNDPERFLFTCKNSEHFVSAFYSTLTSSDVYELPNIARKWENDLGSEYIEDDWKVAIELVRSISSCNRYKETQYKILHRLHITPVILHKMDKSFSPLCIKCHSQRATYFHCFWECKFISRFWTHIAKIISEILHFEIKKDPCVFLVGLPSRVFQLSASRYTLLEKLLFIARKCILHNWIKESPPTVTLWYREIFNTLPHERLQALTKGRDGKFLKIWSPFLDYLPDDLGCLLRKGEICAFRNQKPLHSV